MSWRDDEARPIEQPNEAARELERYADSVRPMPPVDFVDRVMTAVETAPAPRRGVIGALVGFAPGLHRPLQAAALVVVLVAGIGGALAAGELLSGVRNSASPPAPPSVAPSETPMASPTSTPTTQASPHATPSPSPSPSSTTSASAEATEQPRSSSPEASESEHPKTPKPSQSSDASETPEPSDDHGGGSGGGDNSGPGGG